LKKKSLKFVCLRGKISKQSIYKKLFIPDCAGLFVFYSKKVTLGKILNG